MDRCFLCGDDFEDGGVWGVSQGKLLELPERPMVGQLSFALGTEWLDSVVKSHSYICPDLHVVFSIPFFLSCGWSVAGTGE